MKYIIIGASGFVGSHLYRLLQGSGELVVGTQAKQSHEHLFTFDLASDRLGDQIDLHEYAGSYAIICATMGQIDICRREKELSRSINVAGITKLISDLKKSKINPVFISTSAVFDGEREGYMEDDPYAPICEYGPCGTAHPPDPRCTAHVGLHGRSNAEYRCGVGRARPRATLTDQHGTPLILTRMLSAVPCERI